MSIESKIFDRCTTHVGTAALISTRCYPDRLPENATFPLVVFFRVSGTTDTFRTHTVNTRTDIERARFQFDCYAESSLAAKALAEQLMSAWDGYQNDADGIGHVFFMGRSSQREDPIDRYREVVEFQFLFRPSIV